MKQLYKQEHKKGAQKQIIKMLKIASWNVCLGIINKKELIEKTIVNEMIDLLSHWAKALEP